MTQEQVNELKKIGYQIPSVPTATIFKSENDYYYVNWCMPKNGHIQAGVCDILPDERDYEQEDIVTVPRDLFCDWVRKNGYHEIETTPRDPREAETPQMIYLQDDEDIITYLGYDEETVAEFLQEKMDQFLQL